MRYHHFDHGGRRDIIARLSIHRRAGEAVKLVELAPRIGLGEAATHNVTTLRSPAKMDRAMRGVTPALSARRRPLHRRLVESEEPTASPRRSSETESGLRADAAASSVLIRDRRQGRRAAGGGRRSSTP